MAIVEQATWAENQNAKSLLRSTLFHFPGPPRIGAGNEARYVISYLFRLNLVRKLNNKMCTSPNEEVVDLDCPKDNEHDKHFSNDDVLGFFRVNDHLFFI